MIDRVAVAIRPHFAALSNMFRRDITIWLIFGLSVSAIIIWQGFVLAGLVLMAWLATAQWMILRLLDRKAPFSHWTKDYILMAVLAITALSNILCLLPAVYLATLPSLATKITSVVWVLGIQVCILNMWSRYSVFLFALLWPAMIITVLTFLFLWQSASGPSSPTEWILAFGFLFLFIVATTDSLRHQSTTERVLRAAQDESVRRLSQLEETHRLDPLTGLLNRQTFDAALHVMLTDRRFSGGEIAVYVINLNNFKPLNDTYSRAAGDCILIQTAKRIRRIVGDNGIVGRLGGDEFICAVNELDDRGDAITFANDLETVIRRPITWNDRDLKVTASIGAAMTPCDAAGGTDTVQSLCSGADQAMGVAQSLPDNKPVVFDVGCFSPGMSSLDKQALIDGLSTNAIRPYYQPKVHLPSGRIIGFEALARWHHPDGQPRRPNDFIPQIYELGLQREFMALIARQVVKDVQSLLDRGLDPGRVSFNVPEVALATPTGCRELERIVKQHPQTAKHLTFEITEDVFIARAAQAIRSSINVFRALGIRVSLDDFGTGFASFHHLNQLDIDELKIDTSFVAGLGQDPTTGILVRGFLNIASGLNLSVVAEGVETPEQSRDLIDMGCVIAQGYLFSAAVPIDAAAAQLENQQAA